MHWFHEYRKEWLRFDVIAGLITAAVVIPKAMAYATIAGLPVQVGLYTAFIPMIIYAVLGTSRPLSVSTTTTIAILVAAQLGQLAPGGDPALLMRASATLALLVGAILVVASFLRLGFVASFISEPVLVGFKAGIGLVIVLDQIPKLMGIHFVKGTLFHNVSTIVQSLPDTSMLTLAVGLVMICVLMILERCAPRVPAPLVVIALAIAGVGFFGLQHQGLELVGYIPRGLPSLILPDLSLVPMLWEGAVGIALMSFTETAAAGRAFAMSMEPPLLPNRELLAIGASNCCGALLGAMPSGGGTSQTALNRQAGARTQLSALTTAATALLTMLLLAPFMSLMPHAALAAVVIVYSVGLIEVDAFRSILVVRRTEFYWALAALAGVVVLGTLKGILVAILVSMGALACQVADPPIYVLGRKVGTNIFRPRSSAHADDELFPGLLLLKFEGRIFFANVETLAEKMRRIIRAENPTVVALDLSGVFDLEYTALKMMIEGEQRLREQGVTVWLVGLNPEVLAMVMRSELGKTLGKERLLYTLEVATDKFVSGDWAKSSQSLPEVLSS